MGKARLSESVETLFGSGSDYLAVNDYRWSRVMALRDPILAFLEIGPMRTPEADSICQPN
jgi:hypothetical protein